MGESEWRWNGEASDDAMEHLRGRAARQHVESLILRLSSELGQHPDELRRLVEAELGLPIWEASTDQLRGCAAALDAVRTAFRGSG